MNLSVDTIWLESFMRQLGCKIILHLSMGHTPTLVHFFENYTTKIPMFLLISPLVSWLAVSACLRLQYCGLYVIPDGSTFCFLMNQQSALQWLCRTGHSWPCGRWPFIGDSSSHILLTPFVHRFYHSHVAFLVQWRQWSFTT